VFVCGAHLSGLYKDTSLTVLILDANDHLFDIAYAVVPSESKEEQFFFFFFF